MAAVGSKLWSRMHAMTRRSAGSLDVKVIPSDPGIYAWYNGDEPVYVGKAKCLSSRVGGNHLGKGKSVSSSAFKRNVAEHLGFGTRPT